MYYLYYQIQACFMPSPSPLKCLFSHIQNPLPCFILKVHIILLQPFIQFLIMSCFPLVHVLIIAHPKMSLHAFFVALGLHFRCSPPPSHPILFPVLYFNSNAFLVTHLPTSSFSLNIKFYSQLVQISIDLVPSYYSWDFSQPTSSCTLHLKWSCSTSCVGPFTGPAEWKGQCCQTRKRGLDLSLSLSLSVQVRSCFQLFSFSEQQWQRKPAQLLWSVLTSDRDLSWDITLHCMLVQRQVA